MMADEPRTQEFETGNQCVCSSVSSLGTSKSTSPSKVFLLIVIYGN